MKINVKNDIVDLNMNYKEFMNNFMEICCRFGLWILFIWLEKQEAFVRHIGEEELWKYRYPLKPSYIPAKLLWPLVMMIPAAVFSIEYFYYLDNDKKIESIKNDIGAITLAFPLNGVFTSLLKCLVGLPRPCYYEVCFPDGYGPNLYVCNGDPDEVNDARKSFPSGHASFAFTGMVYLTLNLVRELDLKNTNSGKSWKCILSCLPLILASSIAFSRTCDYHHHFTDVIGGAILGTSISSTIYWLYKNDIEKNKVVHMQ